MGEVSTDVDEGTAQRAIGSTAEGAAAAPQQFSIERLEVIFASIAEGITVQHASGAIVYANAAAAKVCGFGSVEELVSTPPGDVVARFEVFDATGKPFDHARLPGRRVLEGEASAQAVMRVRERRSGQEWWSSVRATPVLDAAGKTELVVNVWHDITAERRREEHERYLASATTTLSSSLEYDSMLGSLAGLLVPGLADWCSIHLLEGEELRNVAVTHVDPARIADARTQSAAYPPDPSQPRGVWQVIRTGEPELYEEIPDHLLKLAARDEGHLKLLREVGMKSLIVAPIRIRERVVGTVTLVAAESGRRYQSSDVALAEELGRRAGIAVENTRLFAAERRACERLELVVRAGERLAGSLDYETTLANVVAIVLPALADFAFVDLLEGTTVRTIAAAHDDAEVDALVRRTTWARATRADRNVCALSSGKTGFHPRIDHAWCEDVATSPADLALLRDLALGSLVTVPIHVRGVLLGSLTVCFGKSGRHHTADDAALVEELARRVGVAITQARLFEEVRSAAMAAEEASRLKDEFLATVSHELRTPLNAMMGWSALLRTKAIAPDVGKGLDVIHRNAVAQAKIIEDILDVSRIITGKLRLELGPVALGEVVEEAIEVVRPSANANQITVRFQAPAPAPVLDGDKDRLRQVAWNLLSNAVKFSNPGGTIDVSIEQEPFHLVLTVKDTGRGIGAEFQPFVFDRFHQVDGSTTRRVGGLGLGLSIVRHLTELHGGRATVASDGIGKGATFTVRLPRQRTVTGANEEPAAVAPPSIVAASPSETAGLLRGVRVLVVDDEQDARDLVRQVLANSGAEVEVASSAAAGRALVERFSPDVIVSDIGMPNEDGYSFLRSILALGGRAIPTIALTAYARTDDRDKALAAGFVAYLTKPVDPTDVVSAVATAGCQAPAETGSPGTIV